MPDIKVLSFTGSVPSARADLDLPLDTDGRFAVGQYVPDPSDPTKTIFLSSPTFVSGIDRAIQDLVKGLLTMSGSNYLAINYGTTLYTLTRQRKLPDVSTRILSQVKYLLGYLGSFNSTEDASEQIQTLVNLQAQEGIDTITLELTVQTGGGSTTSILIK